MKLNILVVVILSVVAISLLPAVERTEPTRLNSVFDVMEFDDTFLAKLDFVPDYKDAELSPIEYAIERLLEALLLAISIILGIGVVKLHLGHLYKTWREPDDW